MASPRVSIVIPVYQREALVAQALDSALAQTFEDFEVVVVDNASTDRTFEVCQRLAATDTRVRLFRNDTNIGPVRNWRRGLQESRGSFVKLLFSDDQIEPTFLERTVPLLNEDAAFVFTPARISQIGMTSNTISYQWKQQAGHYPSDDFIKGILLRREALPVSPGTALFRRDEALRDLIDTIPLENGHDASAHGAGPDLLMFLLAAKQHSNIGFVPEPLAVFHTHPGSFSCDDLGGAVGDGYAAAKTWFANQYLSPTEAAAVWAQNWAGRALRGRSTAFLGPSPSPVVSAKCLAAEAMRRAIEFVRARREGAV